MQTQLETFRATVSHRPHEAFLFYADFTPELKHRAEDVFSPGGDIYDRFGMYRPVEVSMKPPVNPVLPDFMEYYAGIDIPEDSYITGSGVLEIRGSMHHFTRIISPLRDACTLDKIKRFPFPNTNGYTSDHMAAEVKRAHAEGRVALSWIGHMYEESWAIRGYEQFLMDMAASPEICEYVLDRLCERNMVKAVAAAEAGVDVMRTGDDVANQRAMMFHPDLWRKFMKPRWAEIYRRARELKPDIQIWYHSDGNIEPIIPELIEIGVTILNPVQPECLDPVLVKREYGKDIVLDGTIGTQTTMPFGTPSDVRRTVRERKETLGEDGALIIAPTHILEPEVPLENILAFLEEAAV